MDYINYTQADANNDGIEYAISKYSQKVVDHNDQMIGAIIFQDNDLKVEDSYIFESDNEEAKLFYENLNKANSIQLRKIIFDENHRYSGELENLFDHITTNIIPTDYVIWCNPILDLKSYLKQIGGFNPPLFDIPNKNILLFSIDS